jgi:hypothetical protein
VTVLMVDQRVGEMSSCRLAVQPRKMITASTAHGIARDKIRNSPTAMTIIPRSIAILSTVQRKNSTIHTFLTLFSTSSESVSVEVIGIT